MREGTVSETDLGSPQKLTAALSGKKKAGKASLSYPISFDLFYWASCKNPLGEAEA